MLGFCNADVRFGFFFSLTYSVMYIEFALGLWTYHFRNTDYDSWGEESDEEPEPDPGAYMPHPYQYGPPPQVVFGAPFPVYYPQPPMRRQKRRKQDENNYTSGRRKSPSYGLSENREPLGERYEDVNRSVPSKTKKKSKQSRVHFSQPEQPPNGYYGYPGYPAFIPYPTFYPQNPYEGKKDDRYKVCVRVNCFVLELLNCCPC